MENNNLKDTSQSIPSSYITVSSSHDSDGYLEPVNHNKQNRTNSDGYLEPVNHNKQKRNVDSNGYENPPALYDELTDIDGTLQGQDTHHSQEGQNYSDIYEHVTEPSSNAMLPSHPDNVYEKPVNENSNTYQQLLDQAPPSYSSTEQPLGDQALKNNNGVVSWTNQQYGQSGNQPVVLIMAPPTVNKGVYEPSKCFIIMTLCIAAACIIVALVLISLQIVIDVHKTPLSVAQGGIIVGVFGGISGILGLSAYCLKFSNQGVSVAMIVLSVMSVILAFMLIIVAPIDIILTALSRGSDPDENLKGDPVAANGILILAAFLEIIVGIWLSVIACIGTCKCCKQCCFETKEDFNENRHQSIQTGPVYNYQVQPEAITVESNLNKD